MSETWQDRLLPLAITRVDDHEACVGAVTAHDAWVRPEPVEVREVVDPATASFRYWQWAEVELGPPVVGDPRPEDRALHGRPQPQARAGGAFGAPQRRGLLRRLADTDVESVFDAAHRSLGLVQAEVRDVYTKRSTGGRAFLRCRFCDPTGREYDWIVPEIVFGERAWPHVRAGRLDPEWRDELLADLGRCETYLTIGLTKPNGRFPGRFGGCHPLVVGVHPVPRDGDQAPVHA